MLAADQFRAQEPQCRVIVLSNDPEGTRRRFEVDAVNRWKFWDWMGPLRRSRRFLLGGGGLLQEDTGPWNHVYYLTLVLVAKLFGARTEVRAIGVDPIQRWFNHTWRKLDQRVKVAGRADRVIERVRATDGDVLVFAHGHYLRILAARWLGQDPRFGRHLILSPATVSILGEERDEPALEAWNAASI